MKMMLIKAMEEADIMMAYADGKTIEYSYDTDNWLPCEDPVTFDFECCYYRIQPTMIYRPFVNSKECFDEMKMHHPFGWVENKKICHKFFVGSVDGTNVCFVNGVCHSFRNIFEQFVFVDGKPFGKQEKQTV